MNEINENDYMQDAKGRLIPKSMVKPQDQLRDKTFPSWRKSLPKNIRLS